MDKSERDRGRGTGSSPRGPRAGSEDSERSIFEVLDAPLPSEVARRRPPQDPSPGRVSGPDPVRRPPTVPLEEPTQTIPRRDRSSSARSRRRVAAAQERRRGRGVATRRVRRQLKHIDPIGVLKMSLLFYAVFLIVALVVVAIIYSILNGAGLFDELVEIGDRAVVPELQSKLALGTVEKWTFFIGIICVIGGALVNAALAFLYNVFSDLIGGVDLTFNEREQ